MNGRPSLDRCCALPVRPAIPRSIRVASAIILALGSILIFAKPAHGDPPRTLTIRNGVAVHDGHESGGVHDQPNRPVGSGAEAVGGLVSGNDSGGDGGSPENQPPIAYAGSNILAAIGEEVTFDAGASFDPGGEIVSYTWHFADGATLEGESVTHAFSIPTEPVYAGPQEFSAELTVVDDDGAEASHTITVDVGLFTIDPVTPPLWVVKPNQNVIFTPSGVFGSNAFFHWQFNDGIYSYAPEFVRKFNQSGVFRATLTVYDSQTWEELGTEEKYLTVQYPPELVTIAGDNIGQSAGLIVRDNVAWASSFSGILSAVDVTEASDPVLLAVGTLPGPAMDFDVSDGIAVAACREGGLAFFRTDDPALGDPARERLACLAIYDTWNLGDGYAYGAEIVGERVYFTCSAGLRVVDVSLTAEGGLEVAPIDEPPPSWANEPGFTYAHMVESDDRVYVGYRQPWGILVLDSTAQGFPALTGFVPSGDGAYCPPYTLDCDGETLAVVESKFGYGRLALFDLSDPDQPLLTARHGSASTRYSHVALVGDSAYVTYCSRVTVIDISDAWDPFAWADVPTNDLHSAGIDADEAGYVYAGVTGATLAVIAP